MEKKLGQRRKRLYSSGKEALFYITVSFTTLRVQHCPCAVKASKPLESEKYMYNCSCICFILTKKLLQIRSEEAIFKKKANEATNRVVSPAEMLSSYSGRLHVTVYQIMSYVTQKVPHSRLARLVVGPFWAWIWTGGGPSVHWGKRRGIQDDSTVKGDN